MNFILFKYQYTTAKWAIGGHVYVYKTCMLKKKQFVMIIQGINFDYKKYLTKLKCLTPLRPNISFQGLHIVLYTFPVVHVLHSGHF